MDELIKAAAVISLVEELFVYGNCGSLADLIEGLSALFIFMITALKVLLPWLQQGQMRSIIQSAMEDWANVCEPRARQIMDQYALLGRLIYIIQISATFVGCIDLIILRPPTLSTDRASNISSARTLIFGPSCWAPNSMPRSLYLFHYHLISMCLCSTIIIYPGWNSFMASAALHLCGQFEVLNASLEERPDDQNDVDQKRRIKKFSIRHDKLLTLGNQLNETVDLIAISEVLSNGFLICLSGIALLSDITKGKFDNVDINFALRISVWYCEIFIYSYIGEKLASEGEKLQSTIYNYPWYDLSVSSIKDIQYIMMRNNSFCYLTAGGIIVMNNETFKEITRLMFSYFSALKLVLD